ncbi:MAG: Asp23/Gls24 family envelope stress response protein [Oscillospiraceae bacterium]
MDKINDVQNNSIKISEDVVSKIVELAVKSVEGVSGIMNSRIHFSSIFDKKDESAIAITGESGSVDVTVNVVVSYNSKVKQVAERIQDKVKNDIQNMTGIIVNKVNVIVEGISFDNEKE